MAWGGGKLLGVRLRLLLLLLRNGHETLDEGDVNLSANGGVRKRGCAKSLECLVQGGMGERRGFKSSEKQTT